jgi:hypothetical protein
MKLNEQISRIKSVMGITESKMGEGIQMLVNQSLQYLKSLTDEMGLGEMDELEEIGSVDEIKVTNVVIDNEPIVYVDFYVNSQRRDFDNIILTIEYEVGKYLPNVRVVVDNIIDNRTFGPGIDF